MPVSLWCALNTGWVKYALVRCKFFGIRLAKPGSKVDHSGNLVPAPAPAFVFPIVLALAFAKISQSFVMSARVVVSSREIPNLSLPIKRRFIPAERAC